MRAVGPQEASTHTSPIEVQSPQGPYTIAIRRGLLQNVGTLAASLALGRRVVIATDTNVAPLYAEAAADALSRAGFEPCVAAMQAGEQHKDMESVAMFVEAFLDARLDRDGWVLALGGGVVGDTAGFAASIYLRGVPLVQAPTTLLAMADSSVGGKVGVDHPRGKNLLGAFKQPALVVADLDTLATLPAEEIAGGMAEIIKAGIIADPALFASLENKTAESLHYEGALRAAIEVKRRIVEADPYEQGERALLNLGHTFGHAFEKLSGYTRHHGYAVAQGMVVAFRLAVRLGMCQPRDEERALTVLGRWKLPVRWGSPGLEGEDAVEQVWQAMSHDKKRRGGALRLVLPEAVGRVKIAQGVDEAAVKSALAEMQ